MALSEKELLERKLKLHARLKSYGVKQYEYSLLNYLDETTESLVSPVEVGERIIILYAIVSTVHHLEKRRIVVAWLKRNRLWKKVSKEEKRLFEGKIKNENELMDFSWRIEAAYILAWTLGLVKEQPVPSGPITEDQLTDLKSNIPIIESDIGIGNFLSSLQFINKSEIHLETLFNEYVTAYARDLFISAKENTMNLNMMASYEKYFALNWLRQFMGIKDWDETSTST